MKQHHITLLIITLIALGVFMRLLPHPANVAPIGAIALFGGLYLPRRMALIVPLIAMLMGDFFIGFYHLPMLIAVYGSFVLVGLIGLYVRTHKSLKTLVGGTMLGSLLFFLITNAAVWGFGTMYAHTLNGLIQSYYMALPFFRNSILGDLFYTTLFVGVVEAVMHYADTKQTLVRVHK